MKRFAIAVILGLCLSIAVPATALAGVTFQEQFAGPAPSWAMSGYQPGVGFSPSYMSASYLTQGDTDYLAMRPLVSRGAVQLYCTGAVITSLPATVTARVRFPGGSYSHPSFAFGPADYFNSLGQPVDLNPTPGIVGFSPGTTGWVYEPYSGGGTVRTPDLVEHYFKFAPSPVVPSGVWCDYRVQLFADRAIFSSGAQEVEVQADVASVLAQTGSLRFFFENDDDYAKGGADIDSVTVVQDGEGIPQPVVRKGSAVFNPRTLNLQSRGNNFMATVDLGAVDASAVTTGTVFLKAGSTNVAATGFTVSDSDGDGVGELRAVFDRAQVCAALAGSTGSVQLKVVGDLEDGSTFSAAGSLTVVQSTTSSARTVWSRWRALR